MMTVGTAEVVNAAIKELQYRPNSLARGLVRQRSATLGVIIVELETPLFLQGLPPMEQMARSAEYNLLFCSAKTLDDERAALDLLVEKDVEGVVFLSTSELNDDTHIVAHRRSGLPVVVINRTVNNRIIDSVYWNNAKGISDAVIYLVENGHQRVGFLAGPKNRRSASERLQGYRRGLEAAGIRYDEDYVRSGDYTNTPTVWEKATLAFLALRSRPTAIIASDDIVAASAMRAVRKEGLQVPDDISIVGVDDQPFCTSLDPPLTTVRLPMAEACSRGMKLLLARLGEDHSGPVHLVLDCPLIVRESTSRIPKGQE